MCAARVQRSARGAGAGAALSPRRGRIFALGGSCAAAAGSLLGLRAGSGPAERGLSAAVPAFPARTCRGPRRCRCRSRASRAGPGGGQAHRVIRQHRARNLDLKKEKKNQQQQKRPLINPAHEDKWHSTSARMEKAPSNFVKWSLLSTAFRVTLGASFFRHLNPRIRLFLSLQFDLNNNKKK